MIRLEIVMQGDVIIRQDIKTEAGQLISDLTRAAASQSGYAELEIGKNKTIYINMRNVLYFTVKEID